MDKRILAWFTGVGITAKMVCALIAIVSVTITITLATVLQFGLPARVLAAEAAIDTLRIRAEANRQGIMEVKEDTQAILCIITLPVSISPAESRLRCP